MRSLSCDLTLLYLVPASLMPCGVGALLDYTLLCSAWIPRAAVETLGIPCFLGGMARGLLGRNHPLHIRQNRSAALKKADVVLLAGGPQPLSSLQAPFCDPAPPSQVLTGTLPS